MALPNTGAISLQDVNVELGRDPSTFTIGMNDAATRALFQVPSGAISMSDGYGKSSQFEFTISTNQSDLNLQTYATGIGWDGSSKVVATIGPGVYISGTTTAATALTIPASFPGGLELTNNGVIVGRGGSGGTGGFGGVYGNSANSLSGNAGNGAGGGGGGRALYVLGPVTFTNNGTIAGGGGGGGGGGGASRYVEDKGTNYGTASPGGGGGGGRSSQTNAPGGSGGTRYKVPVAPQPNIGYGNAGGAGTVNTYGNGGSSNYGTGYSNTSYWVRGGYGGRGGNWGGSGVGGNSGIKYSPVSNAGYIQLRSGGGGAGSGAAITGNPYITWVATGTRLGPIA
jgi:hypothetical protein